jgi:hypothetical protein
MLTNEKTHPCGDNFDAVAQGQIELIRFVNSLLQRRQTRQRIQRRHTQKLNSILPTSKHYTLADS